jgi:hypothetical protein
VVRLFLPGRAFLVRMRDEEGRFAGWRRMDDDDLGDGERWGIEGKEKVVPSPDDVTAVLKELEGPEPQEES